MCPARHALKIIASMPQSSPERLSSRGGEVSGIALRDWAGLLTRRFGAQAVDVVRQTAELGPEALPECPAKAAWFPVATQLRLTSATLQLFLGNDLTALAALLEAETLGTVDRAKRRLLQLTVRPTLAFKATPKIYASLYRPGAANASVKGRWAEVSWTGADFQCEPIWQALQVVALGAMFKTLGYPRAEIEVVAPVAEGFAVQARW